MFQKWNNLTHSSRRIYEFREKYILRPLQKIAARTPWVDTELIKDYNKKLYQLYGRWLPESSVLDIGCGPGKLSKEFCHNHNAKFYVGADYSRGMAKDAKIGHPRFNFICADTTHLPFGNSTFDIVHSTRLFHHLNPEIRAKAIIEQLRVAKRAVILEDLFGFEQSLWRLPHMAYYMLADGSFYRYSLKEWELLLSSINTEILEYYHTDDRIIQGRCSYWVITNRQ
jgi:ubiquinone/menaquinone biosynthesis C-methylase UbiE